MLQKHDASNETVHEETDLGIVVADDLKVSLLRCKKKRNL